MGFFGVIASPDWKASGLAMTQNTHMTQSLKKEGEMRSFPFKISKSHIF